MKISSFWQQAIRTIQFSLVALVCSVALNLATGLPTLAAQVQVPTPHLAIFGWGEKAQGKAEQLLGKAQAKTGKKLEGIANQVSGRAKYDIGRVEDAAQRTGDKAGKMAGSSSLTKGTEQLPKIDAAAAEVAERSSPMRLDEIEARSAGGLNEIQGSIEANKMHKADTSKPGSAMADKVDKALTKATK